MSGYYDTITGKLAVAILRCFGCLPLSVLRFLGRMIGYSVWYSHAKARRITEINLRYCFPQMDHRSRQKLARQSLINTVTLGLEMAALWHKPKLWVTKKIIGTEGFSLFENYLKKENGLILLAPHIGNWEIINVQLATCCELLLLYKPNYLAELDALILNARNRIGSAKLVPTENKSVRLLLAHLKQGKTAGILPDQVPGDSNSTVSAPFFGHQAKTMTLIHKLIQKTKCNVIFIYCKRVPGGFVTVFKEADPAIYSSDKMISATALNRGVEQCILDEPEQYQWGYKRFKGEQSFYDR